MRSPGVHFFLSPPTTLRMQNSTWKMIYLARRNPQLAAADFAQAWREHSALGRQCVNVQERVRGVTQCVRIFDGTWPEDASVDYDGVNLLLLRDRSSADAIWTDKETLAIMRPDEPRVFDRYVREFTLVAREQVLLQHACPQGNVGSAVLVAFVRRAAAMACEEFQRTLSQALLAPTWHNVRCVTVNWVKPERPAGYDFDAIVEWWFADADTMATQLAGSALHSQLPPAWGQACDRSATVWMPTQVSHRRP